MKYLSYFFIFCLFFFNSFKTYSEDALTIKQQLDRIVEEVRDLNKAVFNKSFDRNQINQTEKNNDTERFTSIDIRMYDLEKDIKNLTLQFEEILFKLDDLSKEMISLKTEFNTKIEKASIELEQNDINNNSSNIEESSINEDKTLGKIVLSNNEQVSDELSSKDLVDEEGRNTNEDKDQELNNLTPEEKLQYALDQMMKKNYDKSKIILEDFIINFPENQLSGSAHFWLGKIYLFQSNYRRAAIVFGEGVQKFPKSIKAAEMYYELAKSLKEMEKFPEACKTISLLEENYKGSKFTNDPEKIKVKLGCEVNN